MNGYMIIDMRSGQLLSYSQTTSQFGLSYSNEKEGNQVNPLCISGLVYALYANAALLTDNSNGISANIDDISTPGLVIQISANISTHIVAVSFLSPDIDHNTRKTISQMLLDLFLEHTQSSIRFRLLLQTRWIPFIEDRLVKDMMKCISDEGDRPSWILLSNSVIKKTDLPKSTPVLSALVPSTDASPLIAPRTASSRWGRFLSCYCVKAKRNPRSSTHTCLTQPYRFIKCESIVDHQFPGEADGYRIGDAAESAALLVMEEIPGQPFNVMDIKVPGGSKTSSQTLLIIVRNPIWIGIPVRRTNRPSNIFLAEIYYPLKALIDFQTHRHRITQHHKTNKV
uniref:Uncharacterized protein n=1 Tax=Spongospora subterranea TaxID=70186 RepID=A0A0H5QKN3_9EUKA|eukprot:CRZ01871.1 hypothetical protein [Spongospora subterranea]